MSPSLEVEGRLFILLPNPGLEKIPQVKLLKKTGIPRNKRAHFSSRSSKGLLGHLKKKKKTLYDFQVKEKNKRN